MIILGTVLQLAGYALATLVVWGLFARLAASREERAVWLAIGIGAGPLLLSYVLLVVLRLFPGQPSLFYIGVVLGSCALALALLRRDVGAVLGWLVEARPAVAQQLGADWVQRAGWTVVAVCVALVFILSFTTDLVMNDPLGYAQVARMVYDARSIESYPYVEPTFHNGFYGPWTHPMGYVALLVWGHMLQGTAEIAGGIKLVAPYFCLATTVLCAVAGRVAGLRGPLLAASLFLASPFYLWNAAGNHIDAIRTFAFFAAFVALPWVVRNPRPARLIGLGLLFGAAIFTHSLGVLALPIAAFILITGRHGTWAQRLFWTAAVAVFALLINTPRLYENVVIYGHVFGDTTAVWQVEKLNYDFHYAFLRRIQTLEQRLVWGVSRILIDNSRYGWTYWIMAAGLPLSLIEVRRRKTDLAGVVNRLREVDTLMVMTWCVVCFVGGLLLTALVGLDVLIKNPRYVISLQPCAAVVGAWVIVELYQRLMRSGQRE